VEDGTVMERRHARDYSAENTCGVEGALNNRNSGPIRQKKKAPDDGTAEYLVRDRLTKLVLGLCKLKPL
jgi:hypothetical protein